jgi:hypothetical protein
MKKVLFTLLCIIVIAGCYYNAKDVINPTTNPATKDSFLISYTPASTTVIVGTAGSSVKPTVVNTVGGAVTYTITTLPLVSGISIATEGTISWTSAVAKGTYTITVTATNTKGTTATATYSLFVNSAGAASAPSSFLYSPASSTFGTGTAGASVSPSINNGGATVTYSITPTIAGVSIDASTGIISWGTVAIGNYTLTVKATNSAGFAVTTYNLTVTTAVYVVSFSADIRPVIATKCATCHHNTHQTWTTWTTISADAVSIHSRLKPVSNMPQGSNLATVPTSQVSSGLFRDLFQLWIDQGKQNN